MTLIPTAPAMPQPTATPAAPHDSGAGDQPTTPSAFDQVLRSVEASAAKHNDSETEETPTEEAEQPTTMVKPRPAVTLDSAPTLPAGPALGPSEAAPVDSDEPAPLPGEAAEPDFPEGTDLAVVPQGPPPEGAVVEPAPIDEPTVTVPTTGATNEEASRPDRPTTDGNAPDHSGASDSAPNHSAPDASAAEPAPNHARADSTTPDASAAEPVATTETAAPDHSAPESRAPDRSAPESRAPADGTPESSAAESSAAEPIAISGREPAPDTVTPTAGPPKTADASTTPSVDQLGAATAPTGLDPVRPTPLAVADPTPTADAAETADAAMVRQVQRALGAIRTNANGDQTFTIRLHPEELGTVTVQVTAGDAGLRVGLVAESAATAERLAQQRSALHSELDQQGLGDAEVDVSHRGGDNRSGNQDNETERSTSTSNGGSSSNGGPQSDILQPLRSGARPVGAGSIDLAL